MIRRRDVRALLMGGQACVLYGAAQFSRGLDLAVLADASNLARIRDAMQDLGAEVIAVPPFDAVFLERGHAVHFRCNHPEAAGLRVDVMARMRGVDAFATLWERRTVLATPDGETWDIMALADLVRAKKTQRDKDWPMIRALVEADYFACTAEASPDRVRLWLRELRTTSLLVEVASRHRRFAAMEAVTRPLLEAAIKADTDSLAELLIQEEQHERAMDAAYWKPLKAELEQLRHARTPRAPN